MMSAHSSGSGSDSGSSGNSSQTNSQPTQANSQPAQANAQPTRIPVDSLLNNNNETGTPSGSRTGIHPLQDYQYRSML